jgi:hypothetical protein
LDDEFQQYCDLNKIDDVDKLAKETFNRGFSLLKYGEVPRGTRIVEEKIVEKEIVREIPVEIVIEKEVIKEIPVEKEIIKEIIKEVPVEVIKEIIKEVPIEVVREVRGETIVSEIIKEVPVEVIKEVIKEVPIEKIVEIPVEKIVYIEKTEELDKLKQENENLRGELSKITTVLESFNRNRHSQNRNTSDLYDE